MNVIFIIPVFDLKSWNNSFVIPVFVLPRTSISLSTQSPRPPSRFLPEVPPVSKLLITSSPTFARDMKQTLTLNTMS